MSSCARAAEDTLRFYFAPRRTPFPGRTDAGDPATSWTQRDDDIQFDFFEDEPATSETAQTSRVRLPRRGGSNGDGGGEVARPAARPRAAAAPARRSSRSRSSSCCVFGAADQVVRGLVDARTRTRATWTTSRQIATQSTANGKRLANVLTTPGLTAQQIEQKLRGIAEQEQQNVNGARRTSTRPAGCAPRTGTSIESLALRVSGLAGPRRHVQGDRERKSDDETRSTRRRAARRPGEPPARERRRLGRPLPRAVARRSSRTTASRRHRSRVALSSRTASSTSAGRR